MVALKPLHRLTDLIVAGTAPVQGCCAPVGSRHHASRIVAAVERQFAVVFTALSHPQTPVAKCRYETNSLDPIELRIHMEAAIYGDRCILIAFSQLSVRGPHELVTDGSHSVLSAGSS